MLHGIRMPGPRVGLVILILLGTGCEIATAQSFLRIDRTTRITDAGSGFPALVDVEKVVVAPDGRDLYTAEIDATGSSDALLEFELEAGSRDASISGLNFASDFSSEGLESPMDLAIAPDGGAIYVAAFAESKISHWTRDPGDGSLTFFGVAEQGENSVDGLNAPVAIDIDPNGNHLYAADFTGNAITVFSIDVGTDELIFEATLNSLSPGNPPISAPRDVLVSPDGEDLYATNSGDNSILVFTREPVSGGLTFFQAIGQGSPGVNTLLNPAEMALDKDGTHLYVTAQQSNAVNIFSRDANTGALTFVDALIDGLGGVDGIGGAASIAMGLQDLYVYVAGETDGFIGVFGRLPFSGNLQFLEAVTASGGGGFTGLMEPSSIAVHPAGDPVFVTGRTSDSLHAFEVVTITSFTGTVTNGLSNMPAPCATIELESSGGDIYTAVTDENGFYYFSLVPPDTYTIRVFGVGLAPTELANEVVSFGATRVRDFVVDGSTLRPDISGLVTDNVSGAPLVAVRVRLRVEGNLVGQTYTCAAGLFDLQVPGLKGGTSAELEYELDNYNTETQNITVMAGETTDASQTMNKTVPFLSTLAGTVFQISTNSGITPIAGVTVTLRGAANATVITDDAGTFSFEIIDGTYSMRASKTGFLGQTIDRSVAGGNTEVARFILQPNFAQLADVNNDGVTNAVDVQLVINGVLGLAMGVDTDVNDDGVTNAVDVQLTINAVLGI